MTNQAIKTFDDDPLKRDDITKSTSKNTDKEALENTLKAMKHHPLDSEIAAVFKEMRVSSGQSIETLSSQLGTNVDLLKNLEKGNLSALPKWEVCSPIISNYATSLGIDSQPILRRVALTLQAREKAETFKVEEQAEKALPTLSNAVEPQGKEEQPQKVSEIKQEIRKEGETVASSDGSNRPDAALSSTTIIPAMSTKDIKYRPIVPDNEVQIKDEQPVMMSESSDHKAVKASDVVISGVAEDTLLGGNNSAQEKTQILTPLTGEPADKAANTAEMPVLKVPMDERPLGQIQSKSLQSKLKNYDQPLFDNAVPTSVEPSLTGNRKATSTSGDENGMLRADKRDFSSDGQEIEKPHINDLLGAEKQGLSALSWVVITLFLLSCAYIGWFLYSEPRLGKILLEQLPFLAQFSVLLDNGLITR